MEHKSDCAVHNAPAYPVGPCDCGAVSPMPTEKLAASLIADVPRFFPDWGREMMMFSPDGDYVDIDNVLAALARAMGPDDLVAEAGKVAADLAAFTEDDAYAEPWAFGETCQASATITRALLARLAAQEAQIKGLEEKVNLQSDLLAGAIRKAARDETALAAERAKVAKLVEAGKALQADMLERARIGTDAIHGEEYRIVNAGRTAWADFCAAITEAGQ